MSESLIGYSKYQYLLQLKASVASYFHWLAIHYITSLLHGKGFFTVQLQNKPCNLGLIALLLLGLS